MNNNAAITVEEYENSCFGAEYGICQFPSMSHSEIASLQQSLINEDYGLNIYADAMDGSFPSPSAINNIEMTNLETYMSGPYDDYGRTGICPGPIYTKSVQVKEKNALGKSLKKTVLGSTKTVNMSTKQVLKAYSIVHPSASKDGHTKVATSRGPRDRRIRLSFQTALKFFLVQDRLGFDQPSKALEWLLEKCRPAIDELPTISPPLTDVDCSMGTDQWAIENLGLVAQPSSTVQVQQPISLNNTQV